MRLNIPEGYYLNKYIRNRFKNNKNWLCAVIGPTGSGKSYSSIRMAELWYKEEFNQEFPLEHICFSIKELATLLKENKLKKGDFVVFEEAGVNVNNLEFQNKIQRIFQHVMQSFRSKNIGVIFNLPSIGFLNKGSRVLLHAVFQTKGIDKGLKEVLIKPFILQYNSLYDKQYHKYIRIVDGKRRIEVKTMRFGLPSKELLNKYEGKKDKFVNSKIEELSDEIDEKEKDKGVTEIELKELVTPLYNKGITKVNEISQQLGFSRQVLYAKGIIRVMAELNRAKMANSGTLLDCTTVPVSIST